MITRQQCGSNPLSVALFSACSWLKSRPDLTADPEILLEFVSAWVLTAKPTDPESARQCGIHAVKECAGTVREIDQQKMIEPDDLRE